MNARLPEVVATYLAAYNARDVDGLLATLTEDIVFENHSNHREGSRIEGRAAFETLARQSLLIFSARRQSVVEAVVGGDGVALLIDFAATVAADLPNGWTEGQEIRLRGSSFFQLRAGLIARLVDLS